MSGIDAKTSGSIFHKNYPMVIAQNRHHCSIIPARMVYNANGWQAGQVVAQHTSTGLYDAYAATGSDGLSTAVGVLYHDLNDAPLNVAAASQIIVKGELYQSKLIGLDSNAITTLKARSVTDGSGVQILFI